MNTPNPAPQRRRRPAADAAAEALQQPVNRRPAAAEAPQPVRRSHRQTETAPPVLSFLEQIPSPLRVILIVLCLAVFLTSAVAITRNYLREQELRRKLEAEAAERAQHPLEYADWIVQYALAQDLDPALVSAVILCESSFDPQAVSYLNARGLMQTMPDTAEWIAHKLGEDDEDYSFDLLFDPETNIRFGTWYLGYLSRRFDGDETKIVCAYHAGQGNVDAWLENPAYSSDGVTLDVIPTEDTSAYASRVLRARDVYRKYYFPVTTPSPDAEP